MDKSTIISIIGIIQGVFVMILILPKLRKSKPALLAILLMLVFVIDLSTFLLYKTGLINQFWFFEGLNESTLFLYGPVLYLYIRAVLKNKTAHPFWNNAIHFVPALLIFLATSPLFFLELTSEKLTLWQEQLTIEWRGYRLSTLLFDHAIWYIHAITYFLMCFRLLKTYRGSQPNGLSPQNQRRRDAHIKWIGYLIGGYLFFPTAGFSILCFNIMNNSQATSFPLMVIFMVFHIFGISYIGFQNQDLLVPTKNKYPKSSLSQERLKALTAEINDYFENDKPYLDQNLSLQSVSSHLQISTNQLSQIVNEIFEMGFNDFVNGYRIELAKKFIVSPDKEIYTIEAIANEVGFKSKSSFNSAFKKLNGMTPSEYKKKQLVLN